MNQLDAAFKSLRSAAMSHFKNNVRKFDEIQRYFAEFFGEDDDVTDEEHQSDQDDDDDAEEDENAGQEEMGEEESDDDDIEIIETIKDCEVIEIEDDE